MEEQKKLFTEEEVNNITIKMQSDCKAKIEQITQKYLNTIQDLNSTLNRLNFLLQIVNSPNVHLFNDSFISKCTEEIEYILTIPEDNSETKTEE